MITKDDIATYRATYPREHLDQKAKEQNLHCGTPLGSVLALNTLCDAYEEVKKQRDELVHDMRDIFPVAHRLALELECLLMSCTDTAATAKWCDSANESLEQWREFCRDQQDDEQTEAWAAMRKAGI